MKAEKIMQSFAAVKGFNVENLYDMIKHRKTLSVIRQGYADEVLKIENYIQRAHAAGEDLEQIARTAHTMRRNIGVKYKDMTPDVLRKHIYDRNLSEYKDQLGPSFERLLERSLTSGLDLNASYKAIIDKSKQSNQDLNVLFDVLEKELL